MEKSGASEKSSRKTMYIIIVVILIIAILAVIILALGLGLGLGLGLRKPSSSSTTNTLGLGSAVYQQAAVATDAAPCSQIGADILMQGGSAVDAAISATLCVGVVNLHSTGIGGGGFLIFYNASSGKSYALDFRETAPMNASTFMFNNTESTASRYGGLAIAVPGLLHGMDVAWRRFGKLTWKQLFDPVVALARNGFPITSAINKAIQFEQTRILSGDYPGLQALLAPNGQLLGEGDTLRQTELADTLEKIAEQGIGYFYNSNFTERMVQELQTDWNSIITVEDFQNYSTVEREVVRAAYEGLEVLGMPPPSAGGPVLGLTLNILDHYNFTKEDFGSLSYHRIVEAFKFAFAQRLKLGDADFNSNITRVVEYMLQNTTAEEVFALINDSTTYGTDYYMRGPTVGSVARDYGTSHLSVLAANGDAVSATTTINTFFGSLVRSRTNGIIFNDEMDDFSIPEISSDNQFQITEPNYIEPGKRPLSSMTPSILLNADKSVKMVVGASGGARITTSVAQVILGVIGFDKSLGDAITPPRLHHQLIPNVVSIESMFPEEYQNGLRERNHNISVSTSLSVVQGIYVDGGDIFATSDHRKGGFPAGY